MALEFLTSNDFKGVLSTNVLTALSGTSDVNLEQAEELAISELSPLYGRYAVATELAKTGTDRNRELVRIVVNITAYYLYNVVPDEEIPERIAENFRKEIKHITDVSKGKYSTLTTVTGSDGETVTNFRYGSDDLRSHDPFH